MGLGDSQEVMEWLNAINQVTRTANADMEILSENLTTVEAFLAVQTNWIILAGLGGIVYHGINYTQLHSVFAMMNIPRKEWPALFSDIRIMEQAALPLLNQKAQK